MKYSELKKRSNHKKYGGLQFTKDAKYKTPQVKGEWRKKRSRHQRAIMKDELVKQLKQIKQ